MKREKGEIKSSGFYPIYTSLLFIARLVFFIDVLCIIALGFYMFGMIFGPQLEENENKELIQEKVSKSNQPTEENELENI